LSLVECADIHLANEASCDFEDFLNGSGKDSTAGLFFDAKETK